MYLYNSLCCVHCTAGSVPVKPLRVGVVFCGGFALRIACPLSCSRLLILCCCDILMTVGRQTPGAHNVVWGVYDALKQIHPGSETIGFLDGTKGHLRGLHFMLPYQQ